jgi:hypothetical protein
MTHFIDYKPHFLKRGNGLTEADRMALRLWSQIRFQKYGYKRDFLFKYRMIRAAILRRKGMSLEEIANKIGRSKTQVRQRLNKMDREIRFSGRVKEFCRVVRSL